MTRVLHPARYSRTIMPVLRQIVHEEFLRNGDMLRILDPFAGTGRIHELAAVSIETYGVEIEPEWAALHEDTQVGDATNLPFTTGLFDMVVTSPTYGNRLADHHNAKDASLRRSYTFDLRNMTGDPERQLHPNNTGLVVFGSERYRNLHERAWHEVWRVLKPGGAFVLNISDFVSRKKIINVCRWHLDLLIDMGFDVEREIEVPTSRLRYGQNWESRVAHEKIYVLRRP